MVNLNVLSTEQNNINSKDIELQSTQEILKRINEEDKKVAYCVEKSLDNISYLIDNILDNYNENTRIIYVGSGTSGRLGILDASECPPTYGVDFDKFQGLISGGRDAVFMAVENAEDSIEMGIEDIKKLDLKPYDVVIGLTASGRTPYVVSAINYANSIGVLTGSISCSKNSEVSKIAKCPIEVVVGPEIVTGSTRMKSGTAQKMILNMISTTIMIKLGKVFSGYMVDVKTSNFKLIERAKRIIISTTHCDYDLASKKLEEAGYNVKYAIVMILLSITKEEAISKLDEYGYNVARLIHEFNDKNKGE